MQPPRRRGPDAITPAAPAVPPRWPIEALWAQLEPLRPGLGVEVLAETDSSNTRLLERARAGDTAPCLLVAERQTAGRGRLGRPWYTDAAPGGEAGGPPALTFSIGLVYAPADWSGLSLAVGVALAEALHPRVRLKWPNDLWLQAADGAPRKLGGILIETLGLPATGRAEATRYAVVGVGLNLDAPAPRPGIDQATAGWRELEPTARAPDLLARIALPLLHGLALFERSGFEAGFATRYAARDALAGLELQGVGAPALRGRADGVDARGALRLQTADGLRLIDSAEPGLRPC